MAAAITVGASGDPLIDGLLRGLMWAERITFGFPTSAAGYEYAVEPSGFLALTGTATTAGTQVWAAVRAFNEVASVIALPVTQAASQPAVAVSRVAMTTEPDPAVVSKADFTAYAKYPATTASAGDVWFNTVSYNAPWLGSFAYSTFLHEIGHVFGLKHGHEARYGFPALPAQWDSFEFSVMTYRNYVGDTPPLTYDLFIGNGPQSLMMLDIAALQYMYGANFAFRPGNTLYRFSPDSGEMLVDGIGQGTPRNTAGTSFNVLFRTIWDGGGTDTYDFSGYRAEHQLLIDLRPGAWTDVDADSHHQAANLRGGPNEGFARGQIANAYLYQDDPRSLIENAIGGAGADRITGNQADNRLEGRDGNDMLFGLAGNDVLVGGPGNDLMDGGDGDDTADYTATPGRVIVNLSRVTAQDTVGSGFDTLLSIENVIGGIFKDTLVGSEQGNLLDGGDGNDIIEGRGGNDVLIGGAGIDLVQYAAAPRSVTVSLALQDAWQETGSAGLDFLSGFENLAGSAHADRLTGDAGNNILIGLAGDDILNGGLGNDELRGDDGADTADYSDALTTVRVSLATTGPQDTLAAGRDTLISIENLIGGAGDDLLLGNANPNRIEGRAGTDFIVGDAGDDHLLGGDGNDVLVGGLGVDILEFGSGRDTARYLSAADSRAFAMDRIIGFSTVWVESDRIGFARGADAMFIGVAPTSIALGPTLAVAAAASIAGLIAQLGAIAASTATSLAVTRIDVAAGGAAGSYVAVNDLLDGFDAASDMLIGIQFASAVPLTGSNFFLF